MESRLGAGFCNMMGVGNRLRGLLRKRRNGGLGGLLSLVEGLSCEGGVLVLRLGL